MGDILLPTMKYIGTTTDSDSFKKLAPNEYELPLPPHCGSFAYQRRFHTHEGVDFYAPDGTPVAALEDGIVVLIEDFTGPKVNQPWWNDTQALHIESGSQILVYGEITVLPELKVGDKVTKGQIVGNIKTVLTKDKGRPMSMLHFEIHKLGTMKSPTWEPPTAPQPEPLIDPTNYFLSLYK